MPKYTYRCKACDHTFEVVHNMSTKLRNCDACSTDGSLFRIPSVAYSTKNDKSSEKKTGKLVKEFINDAKKEVEREKNNMTKEFYK